jgi:hypothetical protein
LPTSLSAPGLKAASREDSAGRFAVAGGQGHNELLLVSFHATSGYNANENCQGYFDSFYQLDYLHKAIPLLWIVGGDFNCKAGRASTCWQPARTKSDHVLDGFFADQNGTNFQVTQSTAAQTYLRTNGKEGRLITDTYVDPHGYVVNGHHLSDHCPVFAELRIERLSEGVDTANIVTGSRTRRKSTN